MLRTESEIQNTINNWLSSFFDEETKIRIQELQANSCLLYTSDAADE